MKALLILAVVIGLVYFFLFDHGYDQLKSLASGHGASPSPAATPGQAATPGGAASPGAAPAAASFDAVANLLRQDMDAIPVSLDGPARPPSNAPTIKRKVSPYVNLHPEYQTLTKVCDLIIGADQQRTSFQSSCRAEQARMSYGGTFNSTGSMDHAVPASGHAQALQKTAEEAKLKADQQAIYQRAESSWGNYRTQTSGQVQQLLASLAGKRI